MLIFSWIKIHPMVTISRFQLRRPLQSAVSDRWRTQKAWGPSPDGPAVSGLAPVICKYESVMDSIRGR